MKKLHRGWGVCLGCALLLFCTSGLTVNAFTVYQPYILKLNGFTNAQSSLIITVRSLSSLLSMLLAGAYYRRLSLRTGMSLAGAAVAGAFALFGLARSFAGYCLAAMVLGLGYGIGTMIPIAIVLEHWFLRKRTLALSLCSASTGLSTLGIPSLLTGLIETLGLRTAFFGEAVFIALMSLLTFLLVRDAPADLDRQPYGADRPDAAAAARQTGRALRREHWFLLVPMLLLIGAMTSSGYSHLSVLAAAQGFDSGVIALAITVSGVMMTLGKCVYGWVSERIGTEGSNGLFSIVLLCGMVLCCVMGRSIPLLFAAMCAYGGGLALTTVGLTAWAGDLSSPEQYDATVRRFQIGYAAGSLLFSPLPGLLADRFGGSYVPAYVFFTACTVAVVWIIRRTYKTAVLPR